MVFSSIGGLIGIALLFGGLALIAVHAFARDDDGYYTSHTEQLHSSGYALTTQEINLGGIEDVPDGLLGTLRVQAESTGRRPLFIGIGPTPDVGRYLGRVARSELTDWRHGHAVFTEIAGGAPRVPPTNQKFWVASSQGFGERQIDWDPQDGVWTVVAMNAGGTRDVAVAAQIGAKVGWLLGLGIGFVVVGLVLSIGCTLLILMIGRHASRDRIAEPAQ
jgi:hypothetical protein